MKTALLITAAILTTVGNSIAVEGVSEDWTKVTPANQSLMGDYQGEWTDPPKGNLNSYGLEGRWNECGALYKASPPKVNAARPPMEWQTYDIEYTASVWDGEKMVSAPKIEVRLNGVLIHHDQEIPFVTAHAFATRNTHPKGDGPIRLQDHGNAIQFRNIWITR